MYKRVAVEFLKDPINTKDIDSNLWDRLVWQQALDKTLRKKRECRIRKESLKH